MATENRRERDRAARRRLIITTVHKLADGEGWDAVTTRRLSTEIEYSQLEAAFAELRHAVGLAAREHDADTLTEVFWAALRGLVTLTRTGRLRPGYDSDRLQLLVDEVTSRHQKR